MDYTTGLWYCLFVQKKTPKYILAFILFLILMIPRTLLSPESTEEERELQRLKVEEKKVYLLGNFDPSEQENFVEIAPEHIIPQIKMYLRKETYDAFLRMAEAAQKDKINLKIASAARNFNYQKTLWERKWNNFLYLSERERFQKILEYSAAPGTSRHHWGTDIDINSAEPAYFDFGQGNKEYIWLAINAPFFGFCQTYNAGRTNGYHEEKWHWSYLPLSGEFTREYATLVKVEDVKGFLGDQYVAELNLIRDYVLSINPTCL